MVRSSASSTRIKLDRPTQMPKNTLTREKSQRDEFLVFGRNVYVSNN